MINYRRLEKVLGMDLIAGKGNLNDGLCVMQAVDYVTSGGFSDHPACACDVLTSYAISINDRANDEERQQLKPLIPRLIGTKDSKRKERAEFLVHHTLTRTLPIFLASLGLEEEAKRVAEFKIGEWSSMMRFYSRLRPKFAAYAPAYASDAAYTAAAYVCAYDAASAASDDAAYAYAAAYAAFAYAAFAYAAYVCADAPASRKWNDVRQQLWQSALEGLSKACEIREVEEARG